jgi:DNA repair protein RecO (recombination protein O)
MTRLIDRQPAWLLHSRPFRDTSLLLDFLTVEGRVSALARGARSAKSTTRALLQPFQPLLVSLAGRSELLNLRQAEASGPARPLTGERLFSALYVNELLVRLLRGQESEAELFNAYGEVLRELASGAELEPVLRCFELQLLDTLGYGLQFSHEAETGEVLTDEGWYYLHADSGFVRQSQGQLTQASASHALYPGAELRKIAARDFAAGSTRRIAKRLLRQVLQQHMSERPLTSRELFRGNAT